MAPSQKRLSMHHQLRYVCSRRSRPAPRPAIDVASERRRNPRFTARLPLRLTAATHKVKFGEIPLLTQNISKNGVCFPAPRRIEPGEFIEVEVTLVGHGPHGKDVHVSGAGRVVRAELATTSDGTSWPLCSTNHRPATSRTGTNSSLNSKNHLLSDNS